MPGRARLNASARALLIELYAAGPLIVSTSVGAAICTCYPHRFVHLARWYQLHFAGCINVEGGGGGARVTLTARGRARAAALTPGTPEYERTRRPARSVCIVCKRPITGPVGADGKRPHRCYVREQHAKYLAHARAWGESILARVSEVVRGFGLPSDVIRSLTVTCGDTIGIPHGDGVGGTLDVVHMVDPKTGDLVTKVLAPEDARPAENVPKDARQVDPVAACLAEIRAGRKGAIDIERIATCVDARRCVEADRLGLPGYRKPRGFSVLVPSIARDRAHYVLGLIGEVTCDAASVAVWRALFAYRARERNVTLGNAEWVTPKRAQASGGEGG
jgi:hypothetical protein